MNLSQFIKQASEYHPLQYLLTLPVMSKIRGIGEDEFEFEVIGRKGLYKYLSQNNLTLQELIEMLPNEKYQFEIEYEQEQKLNLLEEAKILNKIVKRKPELKEKLKKLEQEIVQSAEYSYLYALNVIGGRFELGEKAIIKSAELSYRYALYAINGRFELGEPTIAQSAQYSYQYAKDIIKGRFELAEPTIAQDAKYSYYYALYVIKGRFELGEPVIAQNAGYSYEYALNVIKKRFGLGEPTIAQNPKDSYYYAKNVIKGRWELGEKAIAQSAEYSYQYARDVTKGRFELGEPVIVQSYAYAGIYSQLFFKRHDIDLKSESLNRYNELRDLYLYQLKMKFPEFIKIPIEFQEGYLLYRGNGGKNINPKESTLKKWKEAKDKIDKIKKQASE